MKLEYQVITFACLLCLPLLLQQMFEHDIGQHLLKQYVSDYFDMSLFNTNVEANACFTLSVCNV